MNQELTFSDLDRTKLQAAIDDIPPEQAALFEATRLMHRHDWAQIDNVIRGYQQLLDVCYDQEAKERQQLAATLVDAVQKRDVQLTALDQRLDRLERKVKALGGYDASADDDPEGRL